MAALKTYGTEPCWFAARTRYGQELGIRDRLGRAGVEHFIPTVEVRRSRGKGLREKAAVNNLVFLRATKAEALRLANEQGLPVRYIVDCATRTLLVVPDKQMEDFMRVMDLSKDAPVEESLALGDRVRDLRGRGPAELPLCQGSGPEGLDREDLKRKKEKRQIKKYI